jgi:hypothetical protein
VECNTIVRFQTLVTLYSNVRYLQVSKLNRLYSYMQGVSFALIRTLPTYSQLTKELCVKAVRWLGHSHHTAVLVIAAPHQFGRQ